MHNNNFVTNGLLHLCEGYIMPSNTQLHDMIQWIHIREASNDRIIHPMLDMRLYRCRALPPSIFELLLC